jgi:hypothetical protein
MHRGGCVVRLAAGGAEVPTEYHKALKARSIIRAAEERHEVEMKIELEPAPQADHQFFLKTMRGRCIAKGAGAPPASKTSLCRAVLPEGEIFRDLFSDRSDDKSIL